jgi:hypothetical protein
MQTIVPVLMGLAIVTVGLMLLSWARMDLRNSAQLRLAMASLIGVALLINPHLYRQDLVLLIAVVGLSYGALAGNWKWAFVGLVALTWAVQLTHFLLLQYTNLSLTPIAIFSLLILCLAAGITQNRKAKAYQ